LHSRAAASRRSATRMAQSPRCGARSSLADGTVATQRLARHLLAGRGQSAEARAIF
jgi:hypothetical protein